ncbi:hypothetical protein AHAS_Ahas02G0221600 [Arachis hypogaea]
MFFKTSFNLWVRWNLITEIGRINQKKWKTYFLITCWWLWYWRNKKIFIQSTTRPIEAKTSIMTYVQNIKEAFNKEPLINYPKQKREIQVLWKPPPVGWIKIYSDGTSLGNLENAERWHN